MAPGVFDSGHKLPYIFMETTGDDFSELITFMEGQGYTARSSPTYLSLTYMCVHQAPYMGPRAGPDDAEVSEG